MQPETMVKDDNKHLEGDLWREFAHNMDVLQFRDDIEEYRKRLRKLS